MNVLIIGGAGHSTDANSVCIRNMAKEFLSEGNMVWILSMGDDCVSDAGSIDGATLWQVPMDYYRRLTLRVKRSNNKFLHLWFSIIGFLRHLMLIPLYPITSPRRSRKVAKKAEQIVNNNDIKVVVCVFNPYDNIYAGICLKKKYKDSVKVVSYHLDLRTSSINPNPLVRRYIRKHALQSLVNENVIIDKMLIPYSGEKETREVYGLDMSKITFVGFPMFVKSADSDKCLLPFNQDYINVCYIGSLSVENRNPGPILKMIETAASSQKKKILVHFWGSVGNTQSIIEQSPVAVYHGSIENKYVFYIMENADFLLNIGNALAYDMLPSKIFGMFVTGKPIINYISHPQDATIPYFKRYNNSFEIKAYDCNEGIIRNLSEYVYESQTRMTVTNDSAFDDFTPSYICERILYNVD